VSGVNRSGRAVDFRQARSWSGNKGSAPRQWAGKWM
jgi:hypothetical protein